MFQYLSKTRVVSFLLVGAAVVLSGCKETLSSALTDQEATKLTYELNKRQIAAEKRAGEHGMFSVLVPSPHVNDAFSTLDKLQRFTRNTKQAENSAPGIMSSSLETQLYVSRQLAKSLEDTLLLLPGTVAVRVVVAPTPDSGSGLAAAVRQNTQPSASVLIITESDQYGASSDTIAKYIAAGLNTVPERIQVMMIASTSQEATSPILQTLPITEVVPSNQPATPLSSMAPLVATDSLSLLWEIRSISRTQGYLILVAVLGLLGITYRYMTRLMLVRRLQQI